MPSYYRKRYGAGRYPTRFSRRFYRRRAYRKLARYANRLSINYYRAKITMHYSIERATNNTYYVLNRGDQQGVQFIIGGELAINDEFLRYTQLFSECMLIGFAVDVRPALRNTIGTTDAAGAKHTLTTCYVALSTYFKSQHANNAPNFPLNYGQNTYKYFKNLNKHWVSTAMSNADQTTMGNYIGVHTSDPIPQNLTNEYLPTWDCFVHYYIKFRKNFNE